MPPRRRLKPTPSAVEAARVRLAEGTQPGTEHSSPVVSRPYHTQIVAQLRDDIDVLTDRLKQHARTAELAQQQAADAALAANALLDIVTREGGFRAPEDIATIRWARRLLAEPAPAPAIAVPVVPEAGT